MKLRNKKTGDIVEVGSITPITPTLKADKKTIQLTCVDTNGYRKMYRYKSLAELLSEFEDYEEPKEYWYINTILNRVEDTYRDSDDLEGDKQIGNYFETREEAEKAVEKLKAFKRLKDKGFKVDLWCYDGGNYQERIRTGRILFRVKDYEEVDGLLDLLFGGEDE